MSLSSRLPQLLALAAILVSGYSTIASASSSSSWNRKPAWADESSSSSPGRKASNVSREDRNPKNDDLYPYAPGSNNLALDIGQVFLMGALGNHYSDSIGIQGHYTYGVSDIFGFDSSVGYSSHGDGKLSMLTGLTGLRTNLAWYDKVVPYFIVGLGFYKPSYSVNESATQLTTVSPLLFGVHMGPGVDLQLTRSIFFGAALTFHDIFGSTQLLANGTTLDTGGTYTSFLIHAGVTF